MPPALRVVETVRSSTASWFAANADGCIGLAIDGKTRCEVTPVGIDAAGVALTWQAASLHAWRTTIGEPGPLVETCAAAAAWFKVAPPPAEFLAPYTEPLFPAAAPQAGPEDLLARFADVLATILDEPLHTLPGAGPYGAEPLALRLAHFRPDIADRATILLEEAGR